MPTTTSPLTTPRSGFIQPLLPAHGTPARSSSLLAQIVESQPAGSQIHVIADNLSAHKTKKVFEFWETNRTIRIHYTPTYSSWLNQVEIWFSKIQRGVIFARYLHFRKGSRAQAHALHPQLQQNRDTDPLDLQERRPQNHPGCWVDVCGWQLWLVRGTAGSKLYIL
jgi:transposase